MTAERRWFINLFRAAATLAIFASMVAVVAPTSNVALVDAAPSGQASRYIAISPERVLDTRNPGFGTLRDGDTLSLDPLTAPVLAAAGVDALDVVAVAVNLTITEPIAPSWLKSLPTALVTPGDLSTSAVNNRVANETIANLSIVPVGANGRISIQSLRGSHVVVDVQGVFERSTSSNAGRFVPLIVPTRIADTRKTQGPIPAGGDLVIDLTSVDIPATASAALINMVATQTQGSGFLTAHPGGTVPNSSNVNYTGANHTIAGNTIVSLSNGKATIHVSVAATHIVVDVIGYMTGDSATDSSSGLFVPITPERHYDSRSDEIPFGSSPLNPGTSRGLQIAGKLNVPLTGVLGVATNLTMTNTDGPGFLVMYPKDPVPKEYSSVNSMFANHSIANHAIARLDNGKLRVHSHGKSDFIVDITGYFLDGTTTPPNTPRREATEPAPMPDVDQLPVFQPSNDQDYEYLIEARGDDAQYGAYQRNGRKYFGWNPCNPITYAVNTDRATQAQIDAMNRSIRNAEKASGFDFEYVGEVTGSLSSDGVDPRVPGGPNAMAVIAFSDPYATPIFGGGTIGVGGIGPNVLGPPITLASGASTAWIVRGGFALVDVSDIITPAEIESAFTHEIGHMLGLDHVNAFGELMRPVISNPPQTAYGTGDTYGLWSVGARACPPALSRSAPAGEPLGIDVSIAIE
jgi:hypothetical protein